VVAGLVVGAASGGVALGQPTVVFRSSVELPGTVGLSGPVPGPWTVTGLSGIVQRPNQPPERSRQYTVIADGPFPTMGNVNVTVDGMGAITSATWANARRLSIATSDFEDVAYLAGGEPVVVGDTGGSVWVERVPPAGSGWSPMVLVPGTMGSFRPNLGLESVAASRFGRTVWVANEEATIPDSPLSSQSSGTIVRIQSFNVVVADVLGTIVVPGNSVGPQWVYLAEPWHGGSVTGARSGVVALMTLPDDRLVVMERALAFNLATPFVTRMYVIDTSGATDTRTFPSLVRTGETVSGGVVPVSKTLIYQGSHNNLEGLTLGPRLGPGRYALLAVTDDGGTSDPLSTNRLVSFEISGVACSASDVAGANQSVGGDGELSADDIIVFLSWYFAGDVRGDVAGANQAPGRDGQWTADDIIVFLGRYFNGCVQ
jgi:hypothetical protein